MKSGKARKRILNIIIIVLIVIMLFFSREDNQDKFIDLVENIGISNREFGELETIPMEDGLEDFAFYDKGIIVWENKKLIKFKMDGSKEWERLFQVDELGAIFGESNIYICDKETGEIHILNSKGETIKRIYLESRIRNMVEDSASIIVYLEESEMEGIVILDQDGDILEKNMLETGNILTCSIAEDKKFYALSILDLKGDNISSQVKAFRPDGELLFNIPIANEIIIYSKFIDGDRLLMMSDEKLYCIDDGEILWENKLKTIKDIYVGGEIINILYEDRIEYISFDGHTLNNYTLTERYKRINPYNKGLFLYGDEYIMGLNKNKEIFKYKGEEGIIKVEEGRGRLIISYEDRIDIISK